MPSTLIRTERRKRFLPAVRRVLGLGNGRRCLALKHDATTIGKRQPLASSDRLRFIGLSHGVPLLSIPHRLRPNRDLENAVTLMAKQFVSLFDLIKSVRVREQRARRHAT